MRGRVVSRLITTGVAGVLATCAVLATTAGTAAAASGEATFYATCGGYSLTLETGLNASPLLTVADVEPHTNAVIKYELAYDPTGTLVFSKTVDGFTRNSLGVVDCQMTSPSGPYAGYSFDVGFLFTPAG